jgi:glycosyltransferase involved in cell wall biosynthesis
LYGRVIVVNQDIANALFAIGLAPHRTEVLPAFVGTGGLEQPLDPQLVTWMERHRPLLSTVLFFRPEYGFDLLIAALAELRRRHPAFGCLVMGSGDQRAEAEEQVDRAGLHENVLFLGDVEHDACLALMSMCDVFVRPTREDGDSISVREALSLGVSVVASRAGVRPSGAILFQTGDAQDLEDKLQSAVTGNRPAQPPATSPATGCMNRLLEIYAQVDGSEGALCLN